MADKQFIELLTKVLEGDELSWEKWCCMTTISQKNAQSIVFATNKRLQEEPEHPHALALRGWMHEKGVGGEKDNESAIECYEEAIRHGSIAALTFRASLHQEDAEETGYSAAIALLVRAIDQGSVRAMSLRTVMHAKGLGCKKDLLAANGLLKRAVDLGSSYAQGQLTEFRDTLSKSKNLDDILALFLIHLEEKNFGESKRIYYANSKKIYPLLCKEINNRLNELLSLDEVKIQHTRALIKFLLDIAPDDVQFNYCCFRMYLLRGEGALAISLYKSRLKGESCITGEDLCELGDAQLADLNPAELEKTTDSLIDTACEYYYQAYQKGDNNSLVLLTKNLRAEALKRGEPAPNSFQDENEATKKEDSALIARFIFKVKKATWLNDEMFANFLINYKESIIDLVNNKMLPFEELPKIGNAGKATKKVLFEHYCLEFWDSYYDSHLDVVLGYLTNLDDDGLILGFIDQLNQTQQNSLFNFLISGTEKNELLQKKIKDYEQAEKALYYLVIQALRIWPAVLFGVYNSISWDVDPGLSIVLGFPMLILVVVEILALTALISLVMVGLGLVPAIIGLGVSLKSALLQGELSKTNAEYGGVEKLATLDSQLKLNSSRYRLFSSSTNPATTTHEGNEEENEENSVDGLTRRC